MDGKYILFKWYIHLNIICACLASINNLSHILLRFITIVLVMYKYIKKLHVKTIWFGEKLLEVNRNNKIKKLHYQLEKWS